jgi:hypothetical protein
MKTIDSWEKLIPYGIDPLTSEACGLSYRLLCDVTERGKTVLARMFGIPELTLATPWNRGTEQCAGTCALKPWSAPSPTAVPPATGTCTASLAV